jgi:hypothetical protein
MLVGERYAAGLALALSLSGYACSKSRPSEPRPDVSAAGATGEMGGAAGAGLTGRAGATGARDGGGAAGDTSGDEPAIANLLGDAADWETIETLPTCSTRVARDAAKTWPTLSFSSCGPGCRRANVLPIGGKPLGALLGTSARVVDGELRLTVSARAPGKPTTFVLATYAYSGPGSDGVPIAALAETGACFAQVAGRASPNLYKLFPLNGDEVFRLAWLGEAATSKLSWLPQAPTDSLEFFDTGARWGGIEALSGVHVASSATSDAEQRVCIIWNLAHADGKRGRRLLVGMEGRFWAGANIGVGARGGRRSAGEGRVGPCSTRRIEDTNCVDRGDGCACVRGIVRVGQALRLPPLEPVEVVRTRSSSFAANHVVVGSHVGQRSLVGAHRLQRQQLRRAPR